MLGLRIAQSLNITVGDDVILISQGADGSVANDIYRVDALVGTHDSWDSRNVYLPMKAAQEFLAMSGRVHEYAVMLHDIDQVSRVAATIEQRLTTLTVDTWMQVEPTFYSSMETDKRGNRVSLLIILFIVFIGVLNTVLMSVMERTNEFGVLRAIGSRPTKIFQLIVVETLMLALISIFIGAIVVAPLIAWFTLQGFPLPDPIDIGGIKFSHMLGDFSAYVFVAPMIIILTFALLVSIPPGIRAARISPTRAMSNL
jgi:putative ABC transport system permease protein